MEKLEQHLISRGMDPSLYGPALDDENRVATFYLYNLSGQIAGYQQYRPEGSKKNNNDPREGKYFTRAGFQKNVVFGLEFHNPNDRRMFVTEGIFKAGVLHRLGYNAIAVLGGTPKPLRPWFFAMEGNFDMIAIGDPDSTGQKLVNTVGKGWCSPVDLDEMMDYDIEEMLRTRAG
jgi:hypothetical protein